MTIRSDDTATFEKRPAAYGKELFSVHMMLLAASGSLRMGATGSALRALAVVP